MLRTPSGIRTGIFLRKSLVDKIRKILGSFENVAPGSHQDSAPRLYWELSSTKTPLTTPSFRYRAPHVLLSKKIRNTGVNVLKMSI